MNLIPTATTTQTLLPELSCTSFSHKILPLGITIILQKFQREFVRDAGIFCGKLVTFLLGPVSRGFDDIEVQTCIARNEFPESLTTKFEIISLVGFVIPAITTAVDCNNVQVGREISENAFGFSEIILHPGNLTAVSPVGLRFYRDDVFMMILFKLQINPLGR